MSADETSFGARFRAARVALGWSRRAVERACGVTDQTIANVEAGGSPTMANAEKMASALGLTLSQLLAGELPTEPPPKPATMPRGRRKRSSENPSNSA